MPGYLFRTEKRFEVFMDRFSLNFLLCFLALMISSATAADLSGKLSDPNGTGTPSAKLVIVNTDTHAEVTVVTDERGRFNLQLPEGDYAIYLDRAERVLQAQLTLRGDEERYVDLLSALDQRPPGSAQDRDERARPEAGADSLHSSLSAIRDYDIPLQELENSSKSEFKPLADIVNVFRSQQQSRFHGSIFWFHRNDNFDARNFFDPVGESLPEFKRNQFGVSLGAAIGKKLNLLGTYDGLRIIQGSTRLSHVPTPEQKNGDFSGLEVQLRDPVSGEVLQNNQIPQERINPVARRALALFPEPNRSDSDRNFVNNQPVVRQQDTLSIRGDYRVDRQSKLVVSYDIRDGSEFDVDPLPTFGSNRTERNQTIELDYSRNATNRLLAETRVEFEREIRSDLSVNAGNTGLLNSLGISGVNVSDESDEGYPEFRISGYASPGDGRSPTGSVNNSFSWKGSLTYSLGDHTVQVGGEWEALQINNHRSGGLRRGRFSFDGLFSGDGFADFLFGVPNAASRAVGNDRLDLRSKRWKVFLIDNWKINPKYQLTLGFSYDYFDPYRSANNNVSLFYPLLFETPADGEIVLQGSERALELGLDRAGRGGMIFPDRNDWAPRLGFAYSPLGNNRLILRASYVINYSPLRPQDAPRFFRNYPFYSIENAVSPVDVPDIDLSNPFNSLTPTELTLSLLEPRFRTNYQQEWRFTIETEFIRHWNLKIGYAGIKSSHRPRTIPTNIPLPGSGPIQSRRPNPAFGTIRIGTSGGAFTSQRLELDLVRRFTDSFSIRSSFTWNRIMSDVFRRNPSNPRNLHAERATSSFVPPRRFSLNYILDLPFGRGRALGSNLPGWLLGLVDGWRLSGITRFEDGRRFTVTLPGDFNNDGLTNDRPDRLGSGALNSSPPTVSQYFKIDDFAEPAPFSFGNSGRGILANPGERVWDFSLIKRTAISDGKNVELRVELFNAFNHANFERVNSVFGTSVFGQIFGAKRAREIEVALKYSF